MDQKLKILCLHGMSQNGHIFRKKTAVIRKKIDKIADMVYITAPHLSLHPNHTSEVLRAAAADENAPEEEKPFGWWLAKEENVQPEDDSFVGFKESIDVVKDVLTKEGPFDGIFGFSQGAAFASMLAAALENRSLLPEYFSEEFQHPAFRFAIVSASFIPERPISQRIFAHKIKTPSLHMIGETDTLIVPERMEELADAFENPTILKHPGGHVVPSKADSRNQVLSFVSKFEKKVSE
ncbi:unnamed protein product [Cunninghamella blakesleeana]